MATLARVSARLHLDLEGPVYRKSEELFRRAVVCVVSKTIHAAKACHHCLCRLHTDTLAGSHGCSGTCAAMASLAHSAGFSVLRDGTAALILRVV